MEHKSHRDAITKGAAKHVNLGNLHDCEFILCKLRSINPDWDKRREKSMFCKWSEVAYQAGKAGERNPGQGLSMIRKMNSKQHGEIACL